MLPREPNDEHFKIKRVSGENDGCSGIVLMSMQRMKMLSIIFSKVCTITAQTNNKKQDKNID